MVLTDGEDDSLAGLPLYITAGKDHCRYTLLQVKINIGGREGCKNYFVEASYPLHHSLGRGSVPLYFAKPVENDFFTNLLSNARLINQATFRRKSYGKIKSNLLEIKINLESAFWQNARMKDK